MAKAKKKRRVQIDIAEPTAEQQAKGTFTRLTMAYRRIPVIDTMAQTGKLSPRQHNGLARYRDIAIAHERSPMRDSLDKALDGRANGQGLPPALVRSSREYVWLSAVLGPASAIAHAIAVDDLTPAQLAMQLGGAKERRKGGSVWFEPRRKMLESVVEEIRQAGAKLADAIGA